MIRLNLLPPQQKQALRAHVIYALIERLMIVTIGSVTSAGLLMSFVGIRLAENLKQVQARQILSTEYVAVNNDIKQLNQEIGRVETLQKMAISPSTLLRDVIERTPSSIILSGADFDVETSSMRLNGVAGRRADLLAFETAMRASPFVSRLESPISNLFLKNDINFQFLIALNIDALKAAYEPAP